MVLIYLTQTLLDFYGGVFLRAYLCQAKCILNQWETGTTNKAEHVLFFTFAFLINEPLLQ